MQTGVGDVLGVKNENKESGGGGGHATICTMI